MEYPTTTDDMGGVVEFVKGRFYDNETPVSFSAHFKPEFSCFFINTEADGVSYLLHATRVKNRWVFYQTWWPTDCYSLPRHMGGGDSNFDRSVSTAHDERGE